jgi:UDP-GlcNAc3NAcA epimerase
MKIVTVLGARPQFIKAAVVSRVLAEMPAVAEVLVHTGQHYDDNMSDIFFTELRLPTPHYFLEIGSASHGAQTGRMLEKVEQVLVTERPDLVLVYGDTNSTLAGALAAAKLHIPVAHVEAGLRSFNKKMPEELNRIVTDHLSAWLFAPTPQAVANLRREGVDESLVHLVGDVMYDAALQFGTLNADQNLARFGVQPGSYILATIHRAENTDSLECLRNIFTALEELARTIPILVPLHPRTRGVLQRARLLDSAAGRLRLLNPVGYLDMVCLERHARLIVTDSGGVQKEAFFHRVGCVTLRDETEWVELVDWGWNRLVSPSTATAISDGIRKALAESSRQEPPADLYGGGRAARRIVETLLQSSAHR